MRESEIEAYLVKRADALGGIVRQVRWIGRRGAPDRLVILPVLGAKRGPDATIIFVELKAPGKPLRADQRGEHRILETAGAWVETIDSIEGVDALLK